MQESLHLLCPTRSIIQTQSITATIKSYSPIYKTLALIASETVKREIKDKANGLRKKMESFDCFFDLSVAKNIFSVCEQVASTLQGQGMTAQTSLKCINALQTSLQQQRDGFDGV